ncbi:transcriptional regulator GcvA [Reinekea sp. G2M2-21]|uniref:transcriptional regulator GcvA n=1 Tax=Reinekea sp. G2M2-21 TaxID=2788942 RepID=UPI001E57915C|nr:transcriptional regulator GcvA [Reinekea sp. G2M2-21]
MIRLPPLKALQVFEAAGRTGSFQAAAKELYVTPSAISHQVKALEDFLGIELFERRTRKVVLTLTGAAYLESISSAFMHMEVATQRASSAHSGGELKLAVAPAFLDRWLLPRFHDFTNRHPDIELDIHSSIGEIDFKQSNIDMAVYFGEGQWEGVECQLLRPSYLVPVCAPILLEQEKVMEPADLLKFRLLQVKKRPDEWTSWFQLTETPFHPSQGTISFSNGMNTANAAAKGLGIALTDPSLVSEEIDQGDLMIPIDVIMQLSKSFYLVSQKNRPLTPAMTVFRDWITQRMAAEISAAETLAG